ncbi:MAG TPA: UMP kinase [Phycisphaerae bacterium]|nr:UMP kinase [Phycisphaerae bacterium]
MSADTKHRRILLKLSGEALCSADGFGVRAAPVGRVVEQLLGVLAEGVQVGVVVGGGNFIRARDLASDPNIRRVTADYMGMLGTVINGLALRDAIAGRGADARVMSAIPMPTVCEPFSRRDALAHLAAGRVVVFAGGTGSPFFTTDTTAALRAAEIEADLLVKATKVDGVYDADPVTNPGARKYDRLTYQQALEQRLGVMDLAAFSLCWENRIPIVVCRLATDGNLARAARGEPVGTIVTE